MKRHIWFYNVHERWIDWLIDCLQFYFPLKNFSRIWRRHHCRWGAAKPRPLLGAQGLWSGRDLCRATPAVTRGLGFSGLIRRTAPFSRLLRHTRGCGGSILIRILKGLNAEQYVFWEHLILILIYDNRGFLLLHGTWSHLWYIKRSVYAHSLICISYRTYELVTVRYFCHYILYFFLFYFAFYNGCSNRWNVSLTIW
jgi:hypothetical protein